YCMPVEGLTWLPKTDILSYEEITSVVAQLAPLGLRRLRITGGEPTIRPALPRLIEMLRAIPEVEDIALSTNGVKLPELASTLRGAGLDRVNISADSLRADRIAAIARRNLGFDPIPAARAAVLGALEPGGGPPRGNGPAAYYHFAGAPGSIGVITPMTHTYCGSCNRVRLTADGRLRTCLFGDHEVDLRTPLRADEALEPY